MLTEEEIQSLIKKIELENHFSEKESKHLIKVLNQQILARRFGTFLYEAYESTANDDSDFRGGILSLIEKSK